jgi:acetoin utilization protein AcuB
MSVEKIMSKTPTTVEMDDSLSVVKEIFDHTRFHHLLVVDSGKLFGVVSDRDLLKALSPNVGTVRETSKDAASLNKKVHQIMTRKPIVLAQNAGIYDAIEIFNNHNISCIPIVDEHQIPIGIVSWRDILKEIQERRDARPQQKLQPRPDHDE